MPDLTKAITFSLYPGFHNNNVYEGTVTLPSTAISSSGVITRSFTIDIPNPPDILDIMLQGNGTGVTDSTDRPSAAWFKPGYSFVVQPGTQSGNPADIFWGFVYTVEGSTVNLLAIGLKQYTATFTPSGTVDVQYKIVDYSSL